MSYNTNFKSIFLALSLFLFILSIHSSDATLRAIFRRQSGDNVERESTPEGTLEPNARAPQQPRRPDMPHHPESLGPNNPALMGPTPFLPFGIQPSRSRFNDPRIFYMEQPRFIGPSQKVQNQVFSNGLGRKLLISLGLEPPVSANETTTIGDNNNSVMNSLRNSSVLSRLSNSLHSVYGGLSKMYNSTVQQQLNMMQERFKKEAGNGTNPWQQRMAQQVPMFFKVMATRVEEAQKNLNRAWHQVLQANNSSGQQHLMRTRSFGELSIDRMISDDGVLYQPASLFNQFGRIFGQDDQDPTTPGQNLVSQLMDLWHGLVQPQINIVRNQMASVWRDLTSSGALARGRRLFNNNPSSGNNSNPVDAVDDILEEVNLNGSEYKLIEPTSNEQIQPGSVANSNLRMQMLIRLMEMQRDVNQLWNGLSNSIQGALNSVHKIMNPRMQQIGANVAERSNSANNMDQKSDDDAATNEIGDKIRSLNKVQKDADILHDVVQHQQRQQQQQQQTRMARPGFADRFRDFIGNVGLNLDL